MAISERQRLQLADAARAAFGEEPAAILMEVIVPAGDHPATRRDVATLEARLLTRIDGSEATMLARIDGSEATMLARIGGFETTVNARLTGMDLRFDEFDRRMDERFGRMDDRMSAFESRWEEKLTSSQTALRDDLVGVFRQELGDAVSTQTRLVIMSAATAVFGVGGLAVTLAQVLPT